MFSTNSKFDECFKRLVVECEFVEKSLFHDWFHTVCTDSAGKLFAQIQPISNYSV